MGAIRILHIAGAMNRGGAETLIMELYRHIDRSKVQFDFLVYNYSNEPGAYDEEIRSLGGRIYEAQRRFYRGPIAYCRELKNFFQRHPEYKIVHAHQYATSGYMLAMAKKSENVVTIAHSHIAFPMTDFLRRCADSVGKILIKQYADFIFGCSDDAIVALTGRNADGKKRFVMRNAIDAGKFYFSEFQREIWRKKLGASDKTFVVGNVARFTNQKNHENIVKTFAEIVKKREDSLLILVGTGGKQEEIKKLTEKLKIEYKVLFLGSRDDVHDVINAFDVFLMPSRYEGLGIVLIEAQANGLHCVMTEKMIPEEADVKSGLVTRIALEEAAEVWAEACLNAGERLCAEKAQEAVKAAGYDIFKVAEWLQNFYIKNWR